MLKGLIEHLFCCPGCVFRSMVFHAIASSLDDDDFGVMEKSIQERRSEGAVVVEDLWLRCADFYAEQ